jgi:dimethylaniline monooxygenase (N-oxide forming)
MTVAIIGAGPSGLVAAKEARQCGLVPTVFDEGNAIGGQWKPEGGTIWDSMRINNSRHAASFSDHEWGEGSDDFPTRADVYEYLCSYADRFNIHRDVLLNSRVTSIERSGDKWRLKWVNGEQSKSSIFDSVIICTSIFSRIYMPEIPGLDTFPGSIFHARDYRSPAPFQGQSVAIVGNAFSGCDISAEIASCAKEVYSIFPRIKWVMSRYLKERDSARILPFDLALYSRATVSKYQGLAPHELNARIQNIYSTLCHKQAEICPELALPVTSAAPLFLSISDSYLLEVKRGTIVPKKGSITRVEGSTLHLSNGESIIVDSLIFCTGYRADLPFFSPQIQEQLGFRQDDPDLIQPFLLYKTVFHPELPNMAFVGMARLGIVFGPAELQARLACLTLSGKLPWPTKAAMEEGIRAEQTLRDMNPRPQFVRGYIGFCDDLAKMIGVLPDFDTLREEDPPLYAKLWDGPFTTASYRLTGFGSDRAFATKKIDVLVRIVGKPFLNPECV